MSLLDKFYLYCVMSICPHAVYIRPEESFRVIQKDIGDWADATFKNKGTDMGCFNHIKSEVQELEELMGTYADTGKMEPELHHKISKEIADIVIVCAHLSRRLKVDLCTNVIQKMKINKRRTWSEPDGKTGIIHHTNIEEAHEK